MDHPRCEWPQGGSNGDMRNRAKRSETNGEQRSKGDLDGEQRGCEGNGELGGGMQSAEIEASKHDTSCYRIVTWSSAVINRPRRGLKENLAEWIPKREF